MGKMVYRLRREKQQNADGHMIHQNACAKKVSQPSIFLTSFSPIKKFFD